MKPSDGLAPSTPSLPWRFSGVTRVHARSLATHILLQIGPFEGIGEASRDVAGVVSDASVLCPRLVVCSYNKERRGWMTRAVGTLGRIGRRPELARREDDPARVAQRSPSLSVTVGDTRLACASVQECPLTVLAVRPK